MPSALHPPLPPRQATQGARTRLLRRDVEGLRALAVLAVIAYHLAPHGLSGGFAGVDIFFVISGYLIGRHLLEDIQAGQLSFRAFYARRARRILPALVVVLMVVWAFGWWILSGPELESLGRHVLAAIAFSNNFLLWSESGYFDAPSLSKPLLHLWSLGIEEQFYLLVPMLLWLGSRGRSASARWVIWLGVASLTWTVLRPEPSFYLLDTRFWELSIGVLLANLALMAPNHLWPAGLLPRHHQHLRDAAGCAGIVCIGVTLFWMGPLGWPGPQTLVPVLGSALLIASGPSALVNRVLAWRPLVIIGGISYPLYLWHWPAIVYWRMVHVSATSASCLVPVTAAVLLAFLTRYLIEDPVRFGRIGRREVGRPPLWGLAVGLLAVAGLAFSALTNSGYPDRFPPGASAMASWSMPDEDAPWRVHRCYLYPGDYRAYAVECTPARRVGIPRVVLWGDSHAADLYPGLKSLQKGLDFDIVQWTASGCPPTLSPLVPQEFASCAVHRAAALPEMPQAAPDSVILAGAWELYLQEGAPAQTILAAVRDDIRWLHSIGVRHVVLFGPGPTWHVSLAEDLFRYMMLHRTSRIPSRLGGPSTAVRRLDAAMAALATAMGAGYVSILQQLCDPQGCRTLVAPQGNAQTRPDLVFRDRDHLTPSGSRLLIDTVSRQIFPNLNPAAYAVSAR
jgi:peptidoglycan/LPS O-acetylase OafA/YrhL